MINALLSHENDIFLQVEDEQHLIITIIDKVVN